MERCQRCGEPLEAGIGACPSCGWVPVAGAVVAAVPSAAPSPPPPYPPPQPSRPPQPGMPVRLVPPAGPAAATADGSRPATGVPPPADVGVRMDGRLLTFRPIAAGGDEAREDRSADASTVVRVMAYVLVVIALNAMVLAYVSYEELETLELVPVPGPDNSTLTTVVEGPSNPVAVVGLAYYLALVVALAWSALGLARRRGWALTPSVVASVVSMGAFPVGTFIGPAVAFLLTRSAQREAMGLPATRPPRPRPYGDEAHGERRP